MSFGNLVALYNDNIGVNQNTLLLVKILHFQAIVYLLIYSYYPASFYEDMDFDGIKDLVVSPNSDNDTEDKEAYGFIKIWF